VATHLQSILNIHTVPDSNGDTYFEPSQIAALSNSFIDHLILAFSSQSARRGIYGKFVVPAIYVGTAKILVRWITTATSGDVVWDMDHVAIAVGETYDPSANQDSKTVTDTAAGTARLLNEAEITLDDADFAANDEVQFYFVRDAADAADTLAATAWVVGLYFKFNDA
jgi:hypothetical protein